jgi:hypothetical protein
MTMRFLNGAPMSFATPYRQLLDQLLDDSRPDAGHRAATRAPALRSRALATLRHAELDRRLADGADTTDDRELIVRAWQITRPSARERLATALDAILTDAERPRRARGTSVPICREEVAVARDEIVRLVERLRDQRPVRPRGVALARRLLTDGTGPLYVACANDELWRRLHRAAAALD